MTTKQYKQYKGLKTIWSWSLIACGSHYDRNIEREETEDDHRKQNDRPAGRNDCREHPHRDRGYTRKEGHLPVERQIRQIFGRGEKEIEPNYQQERMAADHPGEDDNNERSLHKKSGAYFRSGFVLYRGCLFL